MNNICFDGCCENLFFKYFIMVEDYYVIMVWSEYVLYKVMVIVSIFMYVWIFYKVSDKCRIM